MATSFEKLSFTKDWNNASDFPTYEENEAQVRADMQALHDETKDFINNTLIPGIENLAVPGAGDMRADVYDPGGMMQDIFAYARAQATAAVSTARTNTESAVSEYDTAQTEKFDGVNVRLAAAENALKATPGAITLLKEYRTPGTYTVELPAGTVAVYALAVGAGGAGAGGVYDSSNYDYRGGGGGAGGNALFIGPVLPSSIKDLTVVVGAGGVGSTRTGADGGDSSVFGLTAAGGRGGGDSNAMEKAGEQYTVRNGAVLGGSGGKGAAHIFDASAQVYGTLGSFAGSDSGVAMPMTMLIPSAGGGGGGCYKDLNATLSASNGGACGFGSGGAGGAPGKAGSDGAQCCGGGGGSGFFGSYAGGSGGDGYVAVWIQRAGVS